MSNIDAVKNDSCPRGNDKKCYPNDFLLAHKKKFDTALNFTGICDCKCHNHDVDAGRLCKINVWGLANIGFALDTRTVRPVKPSVCIGYHWNGTKFIYFVDWDYPEFDPHGWPSDFLAGYVTTA